uniref:Uncharacterized protein n=1 Tax=Kalanchoe fedtschenkoi TaxID=63787 RepID=A0A7N0T957_KALFE
MGTVLLILVSCLAFGTLSDAKHGKRVPSALIVGTLQCEEWSAQNPSHFISGASIVIGCGDGMSSRPNFWKAAKTNEHGKFQVRMPLYVGKHLRMVKACSVRLMRSSEHDCPVPSTKSSTLVHSKSGKDKGSTRVLSAGLLTFKPLKQSTAVQVTSVTNAAQTQHLPTLGPKLSPSPARLPQHPPIPQLTPLLVHPLRPTQKPFEEINQVPSSFFFPFPPNPFQPPSLLPPNPLQPPPASIFPPIPGLTPPPASILPPIPGLTPPAPPTSIFPPLPGIPGFTSPPPPPPPTLFPPFPFPPGFPGIPPASSSSSAQP